MKTQKSWKRRSTEVPKREDFGRSFSGHIFETFQVSPRPRDARVEDWASREREGLKFVDFGRITDNWQSCEDRARKCYARLQVRERRHPPRSRGFTLSTIGTTGIRGGHVRTELSMAGKTAVRPSGTTTRARNAVRRRQRRSCGVPETENCRCA